jgi:DNA (cytosine-5)-methyltransferase 1
MLFFTKVKRAQSVTDYESWIAGGVVPTLNAMDNNGEAFATVLILAVDLYNADIDEKNYHTIRVGGAYSAMPSVLIIDGTRVNDVRVYEDGIVPTVISRYGTGGGNVPMIFSHTQGLDVQASETNSPTLRTGGAGMAVVVAPTLSASNNPSRSPQSSEITAQVDAMVRETGVVRRLTPMECERLQGFPDNWTDGQADSNRYKQMGNAVAVPVVEWIISRMVAVDE